MRLFTKFLLLILGTLIFFSCSDDKDIKNLAPTSPTIYFPLDASKDVTSDVVLKWKESTDPEKASVKYDIYLSTKDELTDEDIKSNDQKETTYKTTLGGHKTYFWKIVAKDDAGGKNESKICSFTTSNSLPSTVSNLFPENEAINLPREFSVKWDASSDIDNDSFSYTLYLGKKADLKVDDIKAKDITETEFKVSLDRLTQYFWKVETKDSQGGINSSIIQSFTIGNNLPSMPEITFPLNDANDMQKIFTLKWTESVDPDGDEVKYNVLIGKTNELKETDKYNIVPLTENKLTVTLEGHTKYSWQIEVLDIDVKAFASPVSFFSTINEIPSKPIINDLKDVENGDALTLPISWSASVDSDNDKLRYDVYITKNDDFNESDRVAKDLITTEYTVPAIAFNSTYKVKLVVKDGFGGIVDSDIKSLETKALDVKITSTSFDVVAPGSDFRGKPDYIKWTSAGKGVSYDLLISKSIDISSPIFSIQDLYDLKSKIFLSGIEEDTRLYVRVIAKDNSNNELNSNAFSFIYKRFGKFTDSRDNKVYNTVDINGKIWLAENFAYIPYIVNEKNDNKKCSVYGSNIDKNPSIDDLKANPNYDKYGVMYSWYMLEDITPSGWHIATEAEWRELELTLGIKEADLENKGFRGDCANKFKSLNEWNPSGKDILGINILPGGCWELGDSGLLTDTYIWTSTEASSTSSTILSSWYRALENIEQGVCRNKTFKSKRFYVRLVKD